MQVVGSQRALLGLLWSMGLCGGAAGCEFPSPSPVGGVFDAGADGPASDDRDRDGKADSEDNCPDTANADQADGDGDKVGNVCDNCATVANAPVDTLTPTGVRKLQRDHDGDGRGDVCDLCPHLASAQQDADADGDKIGAPCDPSESVKNQPAEFNGFYDAPVLSEWTVLDAGSGQLSDWERVMTADGKLWWKQKVLDAGRHHLLRNRAAIDEAYVETGVRLLAAQAGGLRSAGAAMGYEFVSPDAYYFGCIVRHDPGSGDNSITAGAYQNDAVDAASNAAWNPAVFDKDARLVGGTIRRPGNNGGDSTITCRGVSADPVNDRSTTVDSALRPLGRVGLRTFGATALFDYIFIVDKAAAL